jgi:hypothetical protein
MDDVVVHGPGGLGSGADGDVLLLGEFQEIHTPSEIVNSSVQWQKWRDNLRESVIELGHAPGGQNLQGRVAGLPCQLEADLTGSGSKYGVRGSLETCLDLLILH